MEDMTALPPEKCAEDKHYLGFFDGETLIAVLDLIERYPKNDTAYIGFFMTKKERQGYGLGSTFWEKNGFALTGEEFPNGYSAYLPMERAL